MATKYGLAIATPFVKGTAGSTIETLRRNYNKDNLIHVASSLGWLVRDTPTRLSSVSQGCCGRVWKRLSRDTLKIPTSVT